MHMRMLHIAMYYPITNFQRFVAEYFKTAYPVKEMHLIDKVGHMLYLTNWEDIIREIV